MRSVVTIAPPNALVFLHGETSVAFPLPIWGAQILATNSCVSMRCKADVDGPTEIVLGGLAEVGLVRRADYEGLIRVRGGRVLITTVVDDVLLHMAFDGDVAMVRIWRSHPLWPDSVTIGISRPEPSEPVLFPPLPRDDATRTAIDLPDGVSDVFICDGAVLRTQRDFNPWLAAGFLATGVVIPVAGASELEVSNSRLVGFSGEPYLDTTFDTPGREVWIFDSRGPVRLKMDSIGYQTRVRAWTQKVSGVSKMVLVVGKD